MKGAQARLIILIIAIAGILVIGASSFALAYWSGSSEIDIIDNTGSGGSDDRADVDNSDNVTSHYLILEPVGASIEENKYCFEYTDAGWVLKYQYGADYIYEGGAHEAGERNAATSDISTVNSNMTSVKVIGYIGTLGQYEKVVVPDYISWNSSNRNITLINLKMSEYPAINLIKDIEITGNVTEIAGISFSGCTALENVYFKRSTLPTIGTYCFTGISPTMHTEE